jgi:hypothetical protein
VALGGNLAVLNIGSGLTGTNATYNGSATTTISNAGVTAITGGTGVTVSASTGSITASIGQSVATSASPTFSNITLSGGSLSTSTTTANVFNTNATTVNIGGGASTITLGNTSVNTNLNVNGYINFRTGGLNLSTFDGVIITTASTATQVLDTFPSTNYHVGKYIVSAVSGSEYHGVEVLMITDGTQALVTTYGTLYTGTNPLITVSADMTGSLPRLLVTPANAVTTIRAQKTLVR